MEFYFLRNLLLLCILESMYVTAYAYRGIMFMYGDTGFLARIMQVSKLNVQFLSIHHVISSLWFSIATAVIHLQLYMIYFIFHQNKSLVKVNKSLNENVLMVAPFFLSTVTY